MAQGFCIRELSDSDEDIEICEMNEIQLPITLSFLFLNPLYLATRKGMVERKCLHIPESFQDV